MSEACHCTEHRYGALDFRRQINWKVIQYESGGNADVYKIDRCSKNEKVLDKMEEKINLSTY